MKLSEFQMREIRRELHERADYLADALDSANRSSEAFNITPEMVAIEQVLLTRVGKRALDRMARAQREKPRISESGVHYLPSDGSGLEAGYMVMSIGKAKEGDDEASAG